VTGGIVELLDHKSFLIVGAGKSGRAVARLLASKGREVALTDDDASVLREHPSSPEVAGTDAGIEVLTSEDALRSIERFGAVIASPGVPLDHRLLLDARRFGLTVTGEIEVAYRYCSSPIVAVTGTNGKSTVVNVLGKIFETAGKSSVVAGNIGTPFASVVEDGRAYDVVVLELSSFQLDTIIDFRADVPVLTNVTPDHLDRYQDSFDLYAHSKAKILNRAGRDAAFVYNADDPVCVRIANGFEGEKLPFSSSAPLDQGIYFDGGAIVRRRHGVTENVVRREGFPPIGVHNLENAMAAVAAATPFEIGLGAIREALASYRPLAHRMEVVRVARGVTYINDSKATNVDATIKSLRSVEGGVVVILGGSDKNLDFRPLADHLGRVKRAILIGETREKIRAAIAGRCAVADAESLEEAVRAAASAAAPGDTVLLAPACASFDMFKNYVHRGEVFRRSVQAL
jgi:UDP-N-acetylmuramoylalanine--D-glutamate ligase